MINLDKERNDDDDITCYLPTARWAATAFFPTLRTMIWTEWASLTPGISLSDFWISGYLMFLGDPSHEKSDTKIIIYFSVKLRSVDWVNSWLEGVFDLFMLLMGYWQYNLESTEQSVKVMEYLTGL